MQKESLTICQRTAFRATPREIGVGVLSDLTNLSLPHPTMVRGLPTLRLRQPPDWLRFVKLVVFRTTFSGVAVPESEDADGTPGQRSHPAYAT